MSAACKIGYVKSPAFSKESSISDSSLAFLETASRVYNASQVVALSPSECDVLSKWSSASTSQAVSCNLESMPTLCGFEPAGGMNEKQRLPERAFYLVLMENDRPSWVYSRGEDEGYHGGTRLQERLGILRQCKRVPADYGEEKVVFWRSSILQSYPVCKGTEIIPELSRACCS